MAVAGEASLDSVRGELWSFFTFDPAVKVTVTGVRWPVARAALDLAGRPSISNRAEADRVSVRAEGGAVVAIRWFVEPGRDELLGPSGRPDTERS